MPNASNKPVPAPDSPSPSPDKKKPPMKARELQDLIDFIAKSGLNKVNIETEEFKLSIQRDPTQKVTMMAVAPQAATAAPAALPAAPAATAAPAAAVAAAAAPAAAKGTPLKAPMIGTFYRSGGPDQPAFVGVGDVVEKGQIVCIIEAMKLFNEIEAEHSGRIMQVLVENASPVEFDQPLFLIEAQ
jgi:acetyl-CoA carboxylase biotin carboxyl carrier protein